MAQLPAAHTLSTKCHISVIHDHCTPISIHSTYTCHVASFYHCVIGSLLPVRDYCLLERAAYVPRDALQVLARCLDGCSGSDLACSSSSSTRHMRAHGTAHVRISAG